MSFASADASFSYIISPPLPTPLNYIPLVSRVLAFAIAAPFALAVALDLIAYVITRTLHISASNLRVLRSPPRAPIELPPANVDTDSDNDSDSPVARGLESRQMSPTGSPSKLPRTSSGVLGRPLQILAVGAVLAAVFLQLFGRSANVHTSHRLSAVRPNERPAALILTAHPDDEVMFFAPTILNLKATGWDIMAICVSDGDADGLGTTRTDELYDSYARLGVDRSNVTVLRHAELQDGMSNTWEPRLIANTIAPAIARHRITHLITFDDAGISGHPNHIALADVHAYLVAPEDTDDENSSAATVPKLLQLQTPPLALKFTGPVWAVLTAVRENARAKSSTSSSHSNSPAAATFVASPTQYVRALGAMTAHASQLVWFRWLYISFSRLMWVNQLLEVA